MEKVTEKVQSEFHTSNWNDNQTKVMAMLCLKDQTEIC